MVSFLSLSVIFFTSFLFGHFDGYFYRIRPLRKFRRTILVHLICMTAFLLAPFEKNNRVASVKLPVRQSSFRPMATLILV